MAREETRRNPSYKKGTDQSRGYPTLSILTWHRFPIQLHQLRQHPLHILKDILPWCTLRPNRLLKFVAMYTPKEHGGKHTEQAVGSGFSNCCPVAHATSELTIGLASPLRLQRSPPRPEAGFECLDVDDTRTEGGGAGALNPIRDAGRTTGGCNSIRTRKSMSSLKLLPKTNCLQPSGAHGLRTEHLDCRFHPWWWCVVTHQLPCDAP